MAELTDLELLAQLRDALDTPPVRPDAASLARLHATLAELEHESEPVSITTAVRHRGATQRSTPPRRRRVAGRSSILVASAVAAALTAGVAAAAVATNTLPGPARAFAYDVGLPVTSPSLYQAQQTEAQLRHALRNHDGVASRRLGQQLIGEMETLDFSDLSQIRAGADTLLVEVGLGLPTVSTTSPLPVTTPVTIPTSSGSSSKVPLGSVPSVSLPGVSTPRVTVPGVRVPSVSVPRVSVPNVSVPSVSIPHVTVPSANVPPVTVPPITLPGLPSL
jgi:hypothetical protein